MKFFLKVIFGPLLEYVKQVVTLLKLRREYPTIMVHRDFSTLNSTFGMYNSFGLNVSIMNTVMGDYAYVGKSSYINNCEIGSFTCIGPNVNVGMGDHPAQDFMSIHPMFYSINRKFTIADQQYYPEFRKTIIGKDVWIGSNVIIVGGISIGDGAIIAAGAVVTKDVLPFSIVGGVPAKFIRYRFSQEEIEDLKLLRWWDKDINWLRKNYRKMHHINNIRELLES